MGGGGREDDSGIDPNTGGGAGDGAGIGYDQGTGTDNGYGGDSGTPYDGQDLGTDDPNAPPKDRTVPGQNQPAAGTGGGKGGGGGMGGLGSLLPLLQSGGGLMGGIAALRQKQQANKPAAFQYQQAPTQDVLGHLNFASPSQGQHQISIPQVGGNGGGGANYNLLDELAKFQGGGF
jgi:hypothetical protein